MRTLFLMAILAVILVIANKKPDQTAWEAARELKQDAQDVIAEVKKEPIVVESADDLAEKYASLEDMLSKTLDVEERFTSTEESGEAGTAPEVAELESPAGTADAGTSPEDLFPELAAASEKATPPPALPSLPDLSPAPATEVPSGESETQKPNPTPPSRLTLRNDYGDVRSAYERASRFLAEIK